MDRKAVMAVVIGLLMIFSVAGFAISGLRITGQSTEPQQQQGLPSVVDRFLSPQEVALVLQQGRVVIESIYPEDCTECQAADGELRVFASKYTGFLVLESVATEPGTGLRKLQMTSSRGEVIPLQGTLTQETLLETFCDAAIVKPRECLLRAFE